MNVLSLFDGISCGRVALERAGIKVEQYLASEIDKYAIQVAKKNYPDTVELGDVKDVWAIGNGWTVDVIAHIFSFLPEEYKENKNEYKF